MPVATSNRLRNPFSKTTWCKFFAFGQCGKGEACEFAHGTDELRIAPDLKKTSLCKFWKEGKCTRPASTCQFAHGLHELRVLPSFEQSTATKNGDASVPSKCGRRRKEVKQSASDQQLTVVPMESVVTPNTKMPAAWASMPLTKNFQPLAISANGIVPRAESPMVVWERVFMEDNISLVQLCSALASEGVQDPIVSVELERMLLDAVPEYYEE
jgi:hypothetical protein